MNNSNNLPPPSYNELLGSAPSESSVEHKPPPCNNQPTTSKIGFEIVNNIQSFKPTLVPFKNFNGKLDTEALVEAIKSNLGDNVAKLLSERTAEQRKEMANLYLQMKNQTLAQDIKKHFGGFFKTPLLLIGLSVPYYEYLARSIHKCYLYKWIYYILFTITSDDMIQFKSYFYNKYGCSVSDFLYAKSTNKKSGIRFDAYEKVLNNTREEIDRNDPNEVASDVARVKALTGGSFKILDSSQSEMFVIKEIFLTKSFSHIKKVCEQYQSSTGTPIQIILKKCTATHNLFSNIAEYALSPAKYFARTLNKTGFWLFGFHDEYLLTHIVLARAEIDLEDIKMEFNAISQKSLTMKIKECCSGSYRLALLQLVGEPEG